MEYDTGHEGLPTRVELMVSCPAHLGALVSVNFCESCNYFVQRESLERGRGKPDKQTIICNPPLSRVVQTIHLTGGE